MVNLVERETGALQKGLGRLAIELAEGASREGHRVDNSTLVV